MAEGNIVEIVEERETPPPPRMRIANSSCCAQGCLLLGLLLLNLLALGLSLGALALAKILGAVFSDLAAKGQMPFCSVYFLYAAPYFWLVSLALLALTALLLASRSRSLLLMAFDAFLSLVLCAFIALLALAGTLAPLLALAGKIAAQP